MKITHEMIQEADVGDKLSTMLGSIRVTWIKISIDSNGQTSLALQGVLRPFWANIGNGRVVHGSDLVGYTVAP